MGREFRALWLSFRSREEFLQTRVALPVESASHVCLGHGPVTLPFQGFNRSGDVLRGDPPVLASQMGIYCLREPGRLHS